MRRGAPGATDPPGPMTDLDAATVRAALDTRRLGRRLEILTQVGSTMDVADELAREGVPDGTVVLADHQVAGRGRLGRPWTAPPGAALLLSIVFRPDLPVERLGEVPMAVALGAFDALAPLVPIASPIGLKWPNDVLAGGAKIGGMLSEAQLTPGRAAVVIVGLGINVHQPADDLPDGATSLAALGVAPPGRGALAAQVLSAIENHYDPLTAGRSLVGRWSDRLENLGREVTAFTADGAIRGRAVAVDPTGGLVIDTGDGTLVTLHAGDVTLSGGD